MPIVSKYFEPVKALLMKQGFITTRDLTDVTGNYKVNDEVIMVMSEVFPIYEEEDPCPGRGKGKVYRLLTKEVMEDWENETYTAKHPCISADQ